VKEPEESVVKSRITWVVASFTQSRHLAPAMIPPDGSCTVPVIAPVAPPVCQGQCSGACQETSEHQSLVNMDTSPPLSVFMLDLDALRRLREPHQSFDNCVTQAKYSSVQVSWCC